MSSSRRMLLNNPGTQEQNYSGFRLIPLCFSRFEASQTALFRIASIGALLPTLPAASPSGMEPERR